MNNLTPERDDIEFSLANTHAERLRAINEEYAQRISTIKAKLETLHWYDFEKRNNLERERRDCEIDAQQKIADATYDYFVALAANKFPQVEQLRDARWDGNIFSFTDKLGEAEQYDITNPLSPVRIHPYEHVSLPDSA